MRISNNTFGIFSLILALVLGTLAGIRFIEMHQAEALHPSPGLTETKRLSAFNPFLEGSRADTDVYYFSGTESGGKVLILGGTHPNEPAGFLCACLLLENVNVQQGTLIIIPRANNSAFSHNDPMEGQPQYYAIQGQRENRRFRFGSRNTNPIDQWPDPEIYLHHPSGQKLAGNETRNLNRSYPGRPDGVMTERVAYAILELINQEQVNLAFDLHEAAPEYPVVNAIIATERSQDIASEAAIELEFEGLHYSLEPSPYNFRGLSHREWQDFTEAFPILLETANPIQGRLRGRTDTQLLLTGRDKMYLQAAELGELHVPYDSLGITVEERVGRHLAAVTKIMEIFTRYNPQSAVVIGNIPTYQEIMAKGIGEYF